MPSGLRLVRDGALARLLIDRPAKRNAFTTAMWRDLARLLDEAADCCVLVVASSTPSIFCAGADLAEFAAMADDGTRFAANRDAMVAALDRLAGFPHPTLAVIGGPCAGAGLALAAACDLRIAGSGAVFTLPPARLGLLYPLADLARLAALIGPAQLKRLVFTAAGCDAGTARAISLVEELVPTGELAARANDLARAIAGNAPGALAALKAMIDGRMTREEAAKAFLAARTGTEFVEGISAWNERRPPRFVDHAVADASPDGDESRA